MADPKATVFQGQEGTGFAQIFQGGPDAYTTMRQPVRDLIELEFTRAKEARAKEEAQKAAFAKLADFNPYFEQFQAELEKDYEGMGGTFVEAYSKGINPEDPTNPVGQQFGKQKADFSRKKEIAKQLFDEYGKQQEALKSGDFDAEHFAKTWEQALQKGSITETFEFLRNSTPLVKNIDPLEGIMDYVPKAISTEEIEGGQYVTRKGATPESILANAKLFVASPKNKDKVDALIAKGVVEDLDGAVEYYRQRIEERTERGESLQAVPKEGGGIRISMGDGAQSDKFTATFTNDKSISETPEGTYNNIQIADRKTGGELRPLEFTADDGKKVYAKFGDIKFIDFSKQKQIDIANANEKVKLAEQQIKDYQASAVREGKSQEEIKQKVNTLRKALDEAKASLQAAKELPTGKRWVIAATKAKRLSEQAEIKKERERLGASFDDMYEKQEDGTYVSIIENQPMYLPIDYEQGSVGHSNFSKLQATTDIDIENAMRQTIEAVGATPAQTAAPKTKASSTTLGYFQTGK